MRLIAPDTNPVLSDFDSSIIPGLPRLLADRRETDDHPAIHIIPLPDTSVPKFLSFPPISCAVTGHAAWSEANFAR